jgi:hypothetical protein
MIALFERSIFGFNLHPPAQFAESRTHGNPFYREVRENTSKTSPLFEVALVLVRFDYIARVKSAL